MICLEGNAGIVARRWSQAREQYREYPTWIETRGFDARRFDSLVKLVKDLHGAGIAREAEQPRMAA